MLGAPMTTEEDVWAQFETYAEILGFVLFKEGLEVLKELLDQAATNIGYKDLLQVADQFKAAGFADGAQIVLDMADKIKDQPSPEMIRIMQDPNPHNRKACLAYRYRQGWLTDADFAYLDEHHPDPELIAFVTGARHKKQSRAARI
jgi:hypothetical protein